MRQRLIEAVRDCQSATFAGAAAQKDLIRQIAFDLRDQFNRLVSVVEQRGDVVVTFSAKM